MPILTGIAYNPQFTRNTARSAYPADGNEFGIIKGGHF